MIRQKIIINDYIFLVDFYKYNEDFVIPVEKSYKLFRDVDIISNVSNDKNIYFVESYKLSSNERIIYPINDKTISGYSINVEDFSENISSNTISNNVYSLYKINEETNNKEETKIPTDLIRIYFPTIKNTIDAVIDIENYINGIKFHYLIDDINNYSRKSETEITYEHQIYSEYVDIYIPSLDYLLFDDSILIEDYELWENENTKSIINIEYLDDDSQSMMNLIPFNTLYYPFSINIFQESEDETSIYKKSINKDAEFIQSQFYNSFNVILYPYSGIDENNIFKIDDTLVSGNSNFKFDFSISLKSEIRFPVIDDFDDEEKYYQFYGIPSIVSKFYIPKVFGSTIKEGYLKYNSMNEEDYLDYSKYDPNDSDSLNYKEEDNELFEDTFEINKTGFLIEFSTNRFFKDTFIRYFIKIDENSIIDNLILPLNNDVFYSWEDVPDMIVSRVTFIDKVSNTKIVSNPVIITNDWYKYLVEKNDVNKLHIKKVYKKVNGNMLVGEFNSSTNPVLFIDKINCSIVKDSETNDDGLNIIKKNSPKIIYKPVFYKVSDLETINIRNGVSQNIGINLDEFMSKVETFKLIIDSNEYIEYGRNNIYVIFNINGSNITQTSGRYMITNENNEFISDGEYYLV